MIEKERLREPRKFAIVQPAKSFIETAEIKVRRLDGATLDEQIRSLIVSHSTNPQEEKRGRPEYLVVDATCKQFLKVAQETLNSTNSNVARDCFQSLVLIAPEAETTSNIIDRVTGIRIINIKKGEIRFPTHPTPAS